MTGKPVVSVVVAMYNAESTILRALQSCLTQSFFDLEVIVVDDGSSDSSCQVVMTLTDPRITLVTVAPNRGPGAARNRGLELARGAWLTVLDADDAYLPSRLQMLLEAAERIDDPLCVLIDRWIIEVDTGDGVLAPLAYDSRPQRVSSPFEMLSARQAVRDQVSGQPFYSRHLLQRSSARYPNDVRFGEDTAFLIQLLNVPAVRLARISGAYYRYTYRPNSLTKAADRLDHLERAYAFLIEECALSEAMMPEVSRLQERLLLDRKWEGARSAFRQRRFGSLLARLIRSPRLVGRAISLLPRHRRFQRVVRDAKAGRA